MILSFALTEKEFLSGTKTETRRNWSDRTLRSLQKAWDEGRLVHTAVNRGLHRGGKVIGQLKLTARPERQALFFMTDDNLRREGDMCATVAEFCALVEHRSEKQMAVIKFVKV